MGLQKTTFCRLPSQILHIHSEVQYIHQANKLLCELPPRKILCLLLVAFGTPHPGIALHFLALPHLRFTILSELISLFLR